MVISCEIYETSLRRVSHISLEMTTIVRLSYVPIIAFKVENISRRKRIGETDVVSDVTCTRKVLLHVWLYDFMTRRYPLNNSDFI